MEIKLNNKHDFTPIITNKSNSSQKDLKVKSLKKVSYSQLKDTINCKYLINDTKISYWKEKNERRLNKIRKDLFDFLNKPEKTNYKSCIKYSMKSNFIQNPLNSNKNSKDLNCNIDSNKTVKIINPFNGEIIKINNLDSNKNNYPDFLDAVSEKTLSTVESTQTGAKTNSKYYIFEEKLNKFRKMNKKLASYNEQFQILYKKIAKLK
jgi:hypothetical protein